MARLIPDRLQGKGFLYSLVLGDMLTKRREPGPLARLWIPAPKSGRKNASAAASTKDDRRGE